MNPIPMEQNGKETEMPNNSIKSVIHAKDTDISAVEKEEYISLTDIARYRSDEPTAVIANWMRSKNIIEFWELWEQLNNADFNPLELG